MSEVSPRRHSFFAAGFSKSIAALTEEIRTLYLAMRPRGSLGTAAVKTPLR